MPTVDDERLQEADLLARAVENVFRKLIRFLVGRISLVKLQEMIQNGETHYQRKLARVRSGEGEVANG